MYDLSSRAYYGVFLLTRSETRRQEQVKGGQEYSRMLWLSRFIPRLLRPLKWTRQMDTDCSGEP
jgi:hypothetical protein